MLETSYEEEERRRETTRDVRLLTCCVRPVPSTREYTKTAAAAAHLFMLFS